MKVLSSGADYVRASWKAFLALAGLVAVLATSLPEGWGNSVPDWVPVVVGGLTTVAVWAKSNRTETPPAG